MAKGLIISGEFGKVIARQKSDQSLEIGELLIGETVGSKVLLQVTDLLYGSQISQQNLELISGMKLEEGSNIDLYDENLRAYNLAVLKSLITISKGKSKLSKELPKFLSEIREITKEDLSFITQPKNPLYIGKMRSGSKTLDVDISLPGKQVFSHHILIPATTGRGKSLDENEEVLIKTNNGFSLKSIGELVKNNSNFKGSKALSMNPKIFSTDFKKITDFVRHKAPRFMYKVVTESGREVMVTGDHNLYAMKDGKLQLLKTEQVSDNDYLPLPVKIDVSGSISHLNLIEILKGSKGIYVLFKKGFLSRFKQKRECLRILSNSYSRPLEKYNEFRSKGRIELQLFNVLLLKSLSDQDTKSVFVTDLHESVILPANFPLSKEFLELLGIYIAEGYCLNDNSLRISCSEKEIQKNIRDNLKKLNLKSFWVKKKGKNLDLGISSSIFIKMIKRCGVGSLSGNKRLPNFFLNLTESKLSILLRSYYEGDGGIDIWKKQDSKRFKVSTTTKSKKLANDILIALLRYGILARCKTRFQRATNTNHKGNNYYRVSISGKENIKKFLSKIGFISTRKKSVLQGKLDYKSNTNVDLIPLSPKEFKIRREFLTLSQRNFAKEINCSQQMISRIERGERRPSRHLFTRLTSRFDSFKDLVHLCRFKWDKIKEIKRIKYNKKYVYDLTIKDNKTFLAGHGGMFVHNSNLTSCLLWNSIDKDYCGILVLDPHDEYYGRNKLGLKDHPKKENVVYYTPNDPPPGTKSLRLNLDIIKPSHFDGSSNWSPPQRQAMGMYHKKYGKKWIEAVIMDKPLDENTRFFGDGTMAVIKRRLLSLLDLDWDGKQLFCNSIFCLDGAESVIKDICTELENSKTVIIDTSSFAGSVEILIGSLISTEVLRKYKSYKLAGKLNDKPVISIILEEAPRVLGKEVLEKGSNIFATIAREGRKFQVGLTAITQLPSLIPRQVLANMNTKIILGIEMAPERQAIIDSASQDISDDNRTIASLDIGEAIITSNFSRFATPVRIPLFEELAKSAKQEKLNKNSFSGISIG